MPKAEVNRSAVREAAEIAHTFATYTPAGVDRPPASESEAELIARAAADGVTITRQQMWTARRICYWAARNEDDTPRATQRAKMFRDAGDAIFAALACEDQLPAEFDEEADTRPTIVENPGGINFGKTINVTGTDNSRPGTFHTGQYKPANARDGTIWVDTSNVSFKPSTDSIKINDLPPDAYTGSFTMKGDAAEELSKWMGARADTDEEGEEDGGN